MDWMKFIMEEFGLSSKAPMRMFCYNKSAISIAENDVYHERHIEMDCHFVREKVTKGDIDLPYCSRENKLADVLTKALGRDKFQLFISLQGMIDLRIQIMS